ncbi:MAG: 5'-3' exonuclease H3TH domain-containing protein, partial [Actinomycetota bacterium]
MRRSNGVAGAPTGKRKLLLLDGHSLAYRAFFALPDTLVTSSGQVTNAVYGFTSMLIKLMADERPDGVAVCFDRGKPAFRVERYPEYKANRRETPDLFSQQLPMLREVLEVMKIPIISLEGYEADDLLATLAAQADDSHQVVVVSGDRDVLQLVRDRVTVMMTGRGITDVKRYDEAAVVERYGVTPTQWTDFVALKGENSDNLPGVPGIGDKTAMQLIQTYGDIDGVIANASELKPKIQAGVKEMAEQIRINKELGRLLTDVELDIDLDDIALEQWDDEEVRKLYTSLEFRTLYERLKEYDLAPKGESASIEVASQRYSGDAPVEAAGVAFDRAWFAFATGESNATVLPFEEALASPLSGWLRDPKAHKFIHDAKPLVRVALDSDRTVEGVEIDTMLAAYLIEPGLPGGYALADVAERFLGVALDDPDAPAPKKGTTTGGAQGAAPSGRRKAKQASLDLGDDNGDRVAKEAVATHSLAPVLTQRLESRGMLQLAKELEFPLIGVLARMEHAGILVDRNYLEELNDDLGSQMRSLEAKIHSHADEPFNVNSTPQLQKILFEDL